MHSIRPYLLRLSRLVLIVAMMAAAFSSQTNACPLGFELRDDVAGCCAGTEEETPMHCCGTGDLTSSCCCAVIPVIVDASIIGIPFEYAPFLAPGEESTIALTRSPAVPPPRLF